MDKQHPITPPPELVSEWFKKFYGSQTIPGVVPGEATLHIAAVAARWGADQELEACCAEMEEWQGLSNCYGSELAEDLRSARRRPASLKEQAMLKITVILDDPGRALLVEVREALELNRRALEALSDD
jgi:hypothetical protein